MYIIQNNDRLEIESFVFSGGEVSVKVPDIDPHEGCVIFALLRSSEDVIKLLMVKDALDRKMYTSRISLNMPYIPYARQDRVCNLGEAFSLQVFCKLINSCNFDRVWVKDPHSDVAPALLDNVHITQSKWIVRNDSYKWNSYKDAIIVSPDAGANKKVTDLCKVLRKDTFIRADKVRDLSTGEIKSTVVYCDDLKGQDCLIVDDICDGGRTFIELGKALKAKGAGKVGLYVTHGIFSKGKEVFDGSIDDVYSDMDWTETKTGE
jgi:ribose-phosphate pyrophosphokinase